MFSNILIFVKSLKSETLLLPSIQKEYTTYPRPFISRDVLRVMIVSLF